MPVQRLKVAILPLDLSFSGPVTHSGETSTTGKSHGKKPDRFSSNDDTDVKKVSRFKYATWNVRGVGEKEEDLDKTLNFKIILKFQSLQSVNRNCKVLKRLKIIWLFTLELTDTPEASLE